MLIIDIKSKTPNVINNVFPIFLYLSLFARVLIITPVINKGITASTHNNNIISIIISITIKTFIIIYSYKKKCFNCKISPQI